MIKALLLGVAIREGLTQMVEVKERRKIFTQARSYADQVGKPLLVVGAPKLQFNHPCGDVTIDISPEMAKFCDAEIADVRNIPYPNGYFGAAFASHILEHLSTIEDACKALDEMERVADKVFVVSPSKMSMLAWANPNHHLWVTSSGDGYLIEQRGNNLSKREESFIISMGVA
jgi:hypothetical protein